MKAVLVIDMPSECIYCPCYRQSSSYEFGLAEDCKAMLRPLTYVEEANRPEWCPLKPMPHSKQMENRWFSDDYSKGWNDCLKELEQ